MNLAPLSNPSGQRFTIKLNLIKRRSIDQSGARAGTLQPPALDFNCILVKLDGALTHIIPSGLNVSKLRNISRSTEPGANQQEPFVDRCGTFNNGSVREKLRTNTLMLSLGSYRGSTSEVEKPCFSYIKVSYNPVQCRLSRRYNLS